MKIRNNYTRNKIDKKSIFLNKCINLKKKIRIKTKKLIPFSKKEEMIFQVGEPGFLKRQTMPTNNKYLKMNDILIFNIVSKNDCEKLYKGILNLYNNNYLKGFLGGELRSKELRETIMSFDNFDNNGKWSALCAISPKNEELYKICNRVDISIFDFSNDTIGIIFKVSLTELFNNNLNKIFVEKVENKNYCEKFNYKKRHIYGIYSSTKDSIRNSKYEDYILEVKDRCNKLFIKYLPLKLDYKCNAPISINLYQTNYEIENRKESFFHSLNFSNGYNFEKRTDISVCLRDDKAHKSDEFIKTDLYYEIAIDKLKIDRSNNLFFIVQNSKLNIINSSSEYINFIMAVFIHYYLEEIKKNIRLENKKLLESSNKNVTKAFNKFEKFNKKLYFTKMLFNNCNYNSCVYKDDYLKNGFIYQKEIYLECQNQYESLKKEYEFRINLKNMKLNNFLAKMSIVIALFALVAAIYFEYRRNNIPTEKNNAGININTKVLEENNE